MPKLLPLLVLALSASPLLAQSTQPAPAFDGTPWNISSGNASSKLHPSTYSPGYAKMASKFNDKNKDGNDRWDRGQIVLQPADCIGAPFADKWLGTAYRFYGIRLGTEPAGGLNRDDFVRRMFSDASAGASQLFTYEIDQHVPEIQKYAHLYNGIAGETQIAVFCPTTYYRLGGSLKRTIDACWKLRDVCDFDVLDEMLFEDAWIPANYRVLLVFQSDIVDQPVLDAMKDFAESGRTIIRVFPGPTKNVYGTPANIPMITLPKDKPWLSALTPHLAGVDGCDGDLDGLWTTHRRDQTFVYNSTTQPVTTEVSGRAITIKPHAIWDSTRP